MGRMSDDEWARMTGQKPKKKPAKPKVKTIKPEGSVTKPSKTIRQTIKDRHNMLSDI